MTAPRSLTTLADHEQVARATRPTAARRLGRVRGQPPSARAWLLVAVAGVAWSLWDAGVGRKAIVNPGGWQLVRRFWVAAVHPQFSSDFVLSTWHDTLTTIGFAVLGTVLAIMVGLVGGIAMSETGGIAKARVAAGAVSDGGAGMRIGPSGAYRAVFTKRCGGSFS
ncbi:MAG: hypothetical protein ABIQ73_19545 [Acidimicrobiales bacterium]